MFFRKKHLFRGAPGSKSEGVLGMIYNSIPQPYCTDLLTDVYQMTFTSEGKVATMTPLGQV